MIPGFSGLGVLHILKDMRDSAGSCLGLPLGQQHLHSKTEQGHSDVTDFRAPGASPGLFSGSVLLLQKPLEQISFHVLENLHRPQKLR